ncbi:MAG TPA: universal stress protein [Burkholderiaceae bacterium]|nr:universal stress protein [Burkholderiaceae bacterium]
MFRNILVPTDGTELSRTATLRAVDLARKEGAWLTFLHVLPERPSTFFAGEGGMFVKQDSPEEFDAQVHKEVDAFLAEAEAAARASDVPFERVIRSATSPHEAIIAEATARGCDLILMASHGRTGIEALVLGSETQKVLANSKIPVLVYR